MKTIIATVFTAIFFISGLSSCQKCTVCEKGSEPDVRICEDDYNNDSQYREAITDKEADGFSCHN
jgi:NADH:ubiquinone oxidoreductase subunit F (NADH-binding)